MLEVFSKQQSIDVNSSKCCVNTINVSTMLLSSLTIFQKSFEGTQHINKCADIMLSVIILSVVMLSVLEPPISVNIIKAKTFPFPVKPASLPRPKSAQILLPEIINGLW